MEGDSIINFSRLTKKCVTDDWKLSKLMKATHRLLLDFHPIRFRQTLREGNGIADWLASSATQSLEPEHLWTTNMPIALLNKCLFELVHLTSNAFFCIYNVLRLWPFKKENRDKKGPLT